jgi:hypothetical protein
MTRDVLMRRVPNSLRFLSAEGAPYSQAVQQARARRAQPAALSATDHSFIITPLLEPATAIT